MAKLPGDWPINAATTSGNDLADKLNRLVDGTPDFSGGVFTGPVVLAADPLVALGAATKQYVDARDAALQTGVDQAKADAATAANNANNKVSKSGDTMSGALVISNRNDTPYDTNGVNLTVRNTSSSNSTYAGVSLNNTTVNSGALLFTEWTGTNASRFAIATNPGTSANALNSRFTINSDGSFTFLNNGGQPIAALDPNGNLVVKGNITAFASI